MSHIVLNFLAFAALFITSLSIVHVEAAVPESGASRTQNHASDSAPSTQKVVSAEIPASNQTPPLVQQAASEGTSKANIAAAPVPPLLRATENPRIIAKDFSQINQQPADIFARSVAIIGAILAVLNLGFTFYKMLRDRHLSIEDDFWFRKIISPTTIEPLLKAITEILETIPTAASTADEKKEFAVKVTTKFQSMGSSMQTLALLYPDLPGKVIEKLRACEDTLTEYAAAISNDEHSQATIHLETLRLEVWQKISIALASVRDEQMRHTFSFRKLIKAKFSEFRKR